MKGWLLFAVLFAFGSGRSQTGNYLAFPDSNAIWHGHFHASGGSDSHFQYGIIGDTILDGFTWRKIYREENCLGDPVITEQNAVLTGALREDNAKRVYYYNIAENNWLQPDSTYLLYDFSLQVGDTIHYNTSPPVAFDFFVLDSIDSVTTAGQYRRRFHLSNYGSPLETWIEGIGSTRDLLSAVTPYPTCSCVLELFCFRQNDTTYYLKSPYLDCYNLQASLAENTMETNGEVFPNPAMAQTTVVLTFPLENGTLQLFDMQGNSIRKIEHLDGKEIQLQSENIPAGAYFMRITQAGELVMSEKIVFGKF